jgi:hypothetical protein
MGWAGVCGPGGGSADGVGEGRRVRCGLRRGTGRDSVPKTEMEEPSWRTLATERLAERGASSDAATDRRQLRMEIAKGELSSLTDPFRRCVAAATPRRADAWRAAGSARRLSYDAIHFSCNQEYFPRLVSTFGGSDGPETVRIESAAV